MNKIQQSEEEEEEELERVHRKQKYLQVRREVQGVFDSSGIVLKTKQARLKVEGLSRDFNELSEILQRANNCALRNEILTCGVLAGSATKFREANNKAKEALDFCIEICDALREVLNG